MSQLATHAVINPSARMRTAIDNAFRQFGLTPPRIQPLDNLALQLIPPATRQSTPNPAMARQTTPMYRNVQNEANSPASSTPAHQSAPNHAIAPHPHQICKTKPTLVPNVAAPAVRPSRRPLTPNHLRAARLLVAGQTTTAVAVSLGIDRHTLARWKRLPAFQREIRALIDAV
jgi:hypothetical protein